MGQGLQKKVFEIRFPQAIPFLSHYDIYNYAPHTSRREEEEYLFSPFCEIKTDSTHLLSAKRKKDEVLVLREIKSSQDTVPVDIDSNLRLMAKLILSYKQILRNLEDFQRWNDHDSENYRTTLNQKKKLKESYKILSEQVLNYIEQQCALLHEKEL